MCNRVLNKKIIVTGAAQGIGAAIATLYANQGADVLLADIQLNKAQILADELNQKTGRHCIAVQVDVSQQHDISTMIETALSVFGRIDVLVNNAGINVFNDPVALSTEEWKRCFSVDLEGVWNCCQAVLPHMLDKQYGNIINIASVHGHKIIANSFPYPVVKHGLIGLTRALGIQYAAQGIRVNSISPGLIKTPIAEDYFNSCENPEEEERRQTEILPCKRIGRPEEVAYTALFLGSDEAAFINATDILIDGGRSQVYCD
ncbi:SDR family oxidoreductase [Providencia burhodogranariea]|uniref:Short chain dehydrogenase n=1 Tax=Providencia burhodogranariea DSM 19968 TaxID=1141662 RepID=K8WII8_9GAMM|nr:SDR family oxidoreductase [Providencia burhodogranariea]EKT56040.1 short chain dehydrogenase [Providencia burhodogranariea DSM 19968]